MRRQTITLEITWDETIEDSVATVPGPYRWNWRELLDLAPHERVEVVDCSAVSTVEAIRGESS